MQDETPISSKRAPQHRDDEDSQQDTLEAQQKPNKISKVDEPNPSNSASEIPPVTLQTSENDVKDISTTVEGGNEGDTDVRRGRTILSLGYLGEGYQGLQANANAKTIEPVLFDAIVKAGAVEGRDVSLDSVRWDKCARTDKGVSAACNYVSLNIKCFPNLVDRINEHLPETMRFWHFQRVGKSFRAHVRAGGRRYIYMLPTSLFRPENLTESENFVFTEETRAKVNQVLSAFVGTHRFHHFTQSIAAKSQEANRTIDSFECGEPIINDGLEWVKLTVVGASFLLYQIRKMVGAAIFAVRDGKGPEYISAMFEDIPAPGLQIAPGEGLFLDECLYDSHNVSISAPNEPITIDSVRDKVIAFRDSIILPSIFKHEKENRIFSSWLTAALKYPLDWEKILKEGNDANRAQKEWVFQEAKRKGLASARGVSTAEEYYQLTKQSNGKPKNVEVQ